MTTRGTSVPPMAAVLSDQMPVTEAVAAQPGSGSRASRDDHRHPRLTSATVATLSASGEATVTFTRVFATQPCMDLTYVEETDNPPVILKVKSWVRDGSNNYTGCVVKGYRGQVLPTLAPMSGVLTLLTQVISGVNTLVSTLTGFNSFGGSAANIPITVIALQQSS